MSKKGISIQAGSEKKNKIAVFLYPIFIVVLITWFTGLIIQTFRIDVVNDFYLLIKQQTESKALKVTGVIMIASSVALMYFTLLHFKESFRFGMNSKNKGILITEGVFSFTRNPFFLSLDIYFLGQALVFTGILFISIALMAVAGIHFYILREEKYLAKFYQKDYLDYVSRVRRYF